MDSIFFDCVFFKNTIKVDRVFIKNRFIGLRIV